MQITRIYVVGAQSTGKTTLAQELSKRLPSKLIPESARLLAARLQISGTDLQDPTVCRAFQTNLVHDIYQTEASMGDGECGSEGCEVRVYDRSVIDALVYEEQYAHTSTVGRLDEFMALLDGYRMPNVLFVVVYPELVCSERDGVRIQDTFEEKLGFHQKFCEILEELGVRFVVLHGLDNRPTRTLSLIDSHTEASTI